MIGIAGMVAGAVECMRWNVWQTRNDRQYIYIQASAAIRISSIPISIPIPAFISQPTVMMSRW